MQYGLPYMGSKSRIAGWVIDALPSGKRFIDLFGGGAAMSHAAALSGKYEEVIYSDADPIAVAYVRNAVNGVYSPERFKPYWVSREVFHQLKDVDPYVRYVWSFGVGGQGYLFGESIEEGKRRVFEWVVNDRYADWLRSIGIDTAAAPVLQEGTRARRLWIKACFKRLSFAGLKDPQCLGRLERVELSCLERLSTLERLTNSAPSQKITIIHRSYDEYVYQPGDVVYCDPPYANTGGYALSDFDHSAFLDWAARVPCYISEYEISDQRFKLYAEREVLSNMSAKGPTKATERLYCSRYATKEKV